MAVPGGTYTSEVSNWAVGPDENPSGTLEIPTPYSGSVSYRIGAGNVRSVPATMGENSIQFSVGNYVFSGAYDDATETISGTVSDPSGSPKAVQNGNWNASKSGARAKREVA